MTGSARRLVSRSAMLALWCLQLASATLAQNPERAKARILWFGDVRLQTMQRHTANALRSEAEVVASPLGWLDSSAALQRLDEILGKREWDVICFNFGMCDLMHRDPRSRAIRAMSPAAGGIPVSTLPTFTKNLRRLVERIRTVSDAPLIWMSSLPLPPGYRNTCIEPGSVEAYNSAAEAVMRDLGVPIVDLHGQITARLEAAAKDGKRIVGRAYNRLIGSDLSGELVAALRATLAGRR